MELERSNLSEAESGDSPRYSITSLPSESDESFPSEPEAVFVALPAKYEDGRTILNWVLHHFSKDETDIIIAHVHNPSEMIPLMGSEIHSSHLAEETVRAYQQLERENINLVLNKYLAKCQQFEFKAWKVLLKAENVTEGLLSLIRLLKITKLVMGAASHSQATLSEKANKVMKEADPNCKIWFIYRGELIFTREELDSSGELVLPIKEREATNHEEGQTDSDFDPHEMILKKATKEAEAFRNKSQDESVSREKDEKQMFWACQKVMSLMTKISNDLHSKEAKWRNETEKYLVGESENRNLLKQEIEKLKQQLQLLTNQRDKNFAKLQQANDLHKQESECFKQKMKQLEDQHHDNAIKLQDENERKLRLEARIAEFERSTQDLENNLGSVNSCLYLLQQENNTLKNQRDKAVTEVEQLRKEKNEMNCKLALTSEFSLVELREATDNFSESKKIGQGGYGCVYRGFLRNTVVAVKKLDSESLQGESQFEQEVAILSRLRHPNFVTLIGSCREASSLVYEFLPNGSLEDRLECKGGTPPLPWQVRTKIIGEISSALIFLHSSRPHPVVHGDLKPDNILLDSNFASKLGDFGIARPLMMSNTTSPLHRTMYPKGTHGYMDPELLSTGEITPKSDVYALGVIILRLLTGKPALKIVNEVEKAANDLISIMDCSAGDWPFVQAKQLFYVGLKCADVRRRSRPNLMTEVWPVVAPLMKAAALSVTPLFWSVYDENRTPSYFMCPILREVMTDPQIASDGFTYEAEGIEGWIRSGRNTSPMTNVPLPNQTLIPNHALRSAITEWLQHRPKPPSTSSAS